MISHLFGHGLDQRVGKKNMSIPCHAHVFLWLDITVMHGWFGPEAPFPLGNGNVEVLPSSCIHRGGREAVSQVKIENLETEVKTLSKKLETKQKQASLDSLDPHQQRAAVSSAIPTGVFQGKSQQTPRSFHRKKP